MMPIDFSDKSPLIPISIAADMLGVHTRTLMLYEYEQLVIPKRNPQNRRLYSKDEIRRIRFIRFLTQEKGLNFAGVRLVLTMLEEAVKYGIGNFRAEIFPDYIEE